MNKPKKINLNQWEKVDQLSDLDNYQSLIITPVKLIDGTQLPDLYFRKGIKKYNEVEDISLIEWFKDIRISKEGTDEEYSQRVDWWYNKALENDSYRELINSSFNKHNFDVKKAWNMSQNYLKKFNYSARKTYLHKYVWNWLSSEMHKWLKFKK
jgi:hypothetical protein